MCADDNSWESLLELLRSKGFIPRDRLVKAWRNGAVSVPIEIQEYCAGVLSKAISGDPKPVVVSPASWSEQTRTCH